MGEMSERLQAAIAALNSGGAEAEARLEALYHPGVHFQDPFHTLDGREAFLEYNRRLMRKARSLRMDLHEIHETDDVVVATWTIHFAPRRGPAVAFDGVSVLHHDGERVLSHRDYFDPVGDALQAVPGLGRAWKAVARRMA